VVISGSPAGSSRAFITVLSIIYLIQQITGS